MITAKTEFLVERPKDKETGEELADLLHIHTDRNLGELSSGGMKGFEGFAKHIIADIGGIDFIKQLGICSFQVVVGQCFDPKVVETAIVDALKIFRSNLELPNNSLSLIQP